MNYMTDTEHDTLVAGIMKQKKEHIAEALVAVLRQWADEVPVSEHDCDTELDLILELLEESTGADL